MLEWSGEEGARGACIYACGCLACITLFFSRIPVVVYVTCPAKWEIWKASFFFSGRFKRLFVTHWAKSFSAKEASVPVWWWCVQGGGWQGGVV